MFFLFLRNYRNQLITINPSLITINDHQSPNHHWSLLSSYIALVINHQPSTIQVQGISGLGCSAVRPSCCLGLHREHEAFTELLAHGGLRTMCLFRQPLIQSMQWMGHPQKAYRRSKISTGIYICIIYVYDIYVIYVWLCVVIYLIT